MTGAALTQDRTWRCQVGDLLGEVDATVAQADAFAAGAGLDEDRRYALQVCIEEGLANLVMHAEARAAGKRIALELQAGRDAFRILISDSCRPFDVTRVPLPEGAKKAEPGGRGIGLMRAFSRQMRYWSSDERNFLEIEI